MKKTASSKKSKKNDTSKPSVHVKDLKPRKNPKGGDRITDITYSNMRDKTQTATKQAAAIKALL